MSQGTRAKVADRTVSRYGAVMGTMVSVQVLPGSLTESEVEAAIGAAFGRLEAVDETFSPWKPDSVLSRLRSGRLALADAPSDLPAIMCLCRDAHTISRGWFDAWAMPGGFDPTGLVKGWAVEQALSLLVARGVEAAVVNAGGDIACFGPPPYGDRWLIGIRHPWRADSLACILQVERCIATSGCYERGPHLVSPFGATGAAGVASASVTGPSLAIADALATALAVGGGEVLACIGALEGYEGYMIAIDGEEAATDGIAFARADSPAHSEGPAW
jgi:FAD:protein FMN transferase